MDNPGRFIKIELGIIGESHGTAVGDGMDVARFVGHYLRAVQSADDFSNNRLS